MEDPVALLRYVTTRLGGAGITYMVSGSMADFVVRKDEPYRVEELRRRRRLRVGDLEAWVVSPEDLILSKLVWSKDSHSELQLRDVRTLLRTTPGLDVDYLDRWAATLGVSDALEEARR